MVSSLSQGWEGFAQAEDIGLLMKYTKSRPVPGGAATPSIQGVGRTEGIVQADEPPSPR